MKLHALEIPDDPAQLPEWLEWHMMGLDLAELIAELSAVHAVRPAPGPSVREVLGDHLDAVLGQGLRVLRLGILQQLLLRPHLLVELQELVLASGGAYWERVGSSPEISKKLERGRKRLEDFLTGQAQGEPALPQVLALAAEDRKGQPKPAVSSLGSVIAWYRRPWVVSLATAATMLVGVFLYQRHDGRPSAVTVATAPVSWGWSKPGALPQDLPADAYLNRLAAAAAEWFEKRPDAPTALARRIAEFRQGCSVLILSPHAPLQERDRQWLVEKCRGWAAKLDQHLAALEAGEEPLAVRAAADETVRKLIDALRTRAPERSQA